MTTALIPQSGRRPHLDTAAMAPVLELQDPLAEVLGALPPQGRFRYTYDDAVRLSGHSCPTVAGAWLLTTFALRELWPEGVPVRGQIEVTVGGEADDGSSGPMAQVIGLVTGAATATGFGGLMGHWRRRDLLRFDPTLAGSVRFHRSDNGAEIVLRYQPERVHTSPEIGGLLARILGRRASTAECQRFAELWQARVQAILGGDPGFVIDVVSRVAPAVQS